MSEATRCAYCKDGLEAASVGEPADLPGAGGEALECAACGSLLHAACADQHGRCVTLGCPGRRFRAPLAAGARGRLSPRLRWTTRLRQGGARAAVALRDEAALLLTLGGLGVAWMVVQVLS